MVEEEGVSAIPAPPDWAVIRTDYEAGNDPLTVICARYGITRSALSWRVKCDFWSKRYRKGRNDRTTLIDRMFRVLERQIVQLEKPMSKPGDKDTAGEMNTPSDKEAALLGTMARTLEKLIEIDAAQGDKKPRRSQSKDMKDLRNKIAKRIDQLQHD